MVRRRRTVLLVDDEPLILKALADELEDFAKVTTAACGEEALRLLDEETFDVVVCDLRLPDRWGDELLAHVAARSPETRRLLLTADPSPERAVSELLSVGVIQACYQKPRTDSLVAAIRNS
jgi:two-component system response regulator HupR/HoxA